MQRVLRLQGREGDQHVFLVVVVAAIVFRVSFGVWHWITSEEEATAGTVMLAGLPIHLGLADADQAC